MRFEKQLAISAAVGLFLFVTVTGVRAIQSGNPAYSQEVSFTPTKGATGPAGPSTIGSPNTRTVTPGTAFQASDPSKPAFVIVNLSSSAGLSLTGGTTNTAVMVIGSTSGIGTSGGAVVGNYSNSNTGALTIGLALSTVQAGPLYAFLPAGQWAAIRVTAGSVTVTGATDQSIG